MPLSDDIQRLREEAISQGVEPVPAMLQGVSKERIHEVLEALDRVTQDQIDAVYALLDNTQPTWMAKMPDEFTFSDGATTGQIACHIGILQRGKTKLDREGRDYWIKPLRDIGAIEAVYADPSSETFLSGHPVAKSSRSAYRLDNEFKAILRAPDNEWRDLLESWADDDVTRKRLLFQAEQAQATLKIVDTAHRDLIQACCGHYAPAFLPDYQILYVDDSDGDRVSEEEKALLKKAGLSLSLEDAMPDVLLWNPKSDELWVIEAVISDGEVDKHKVERLREFAARHKKKGIQFTTAYASWRAAAARQSKHKNIPDGTYLWIREDASKHLLIESYSA